MTPAVISSAIPCNCCGATQTRPLEHLSALLNIAPPGKAVKCQNCALIYLSPRPPEAEIFEVYADEDYYQRSPLAGGNEEVAPHLLDRLKSLEQFLGRKGHLLDLGCALGTFVAYAQAEGWEAEGVDVSPWSTAFARDKRGLKVRTGTLEAQGYPDQQFDVVHTSHMLEHVPDPLATLKEVRRILRPNGLLAIEVPQEVERLFELVRDVLRLRQPSPIPNSHLYFFTHTTLRQLVQRAGFTPFQIRTRNFPIESKSKYPFGTPVTRALFALDNALLRGANIELVAR